MLYTLNVYDKNKYERILGLYWWLYIHTRSHPQTYKHINLNYWWIKYIKFLMFDCTFDFEKIPLS